ncbi:DMT family transporter [Ekhidna sp.]|uniref:DMT family transporter n=1 Tax=Ekhidna sp. TaxID=2608089 RepID=UPI003CCB85F4
MQKTPLLAWVLLFTLAFIWGSSFILIKKGLVGLTPQEVGSLRIASASLFLLPSAIRRVKYVDRKRIAYLVFSGFLGSLIPAFLFAIAQTRLESAITGVLNGLVPIFTILIALFVFGQKQTKAVYAGVIIGFIGTAILITAGEGNSLNGINVFALLVVLATLCYASNLNLIKQKLNDLHAVTVTSVSLILVGPIALIYLFGFTDFWSKLLTQESTGMATFYICLLGVLGTAIALIIFNKILQMKNALFASSVTYIIPIFAVMWGVLDGEKLYVMHFIGMLAVGVGVYIANTNRAAHRNAGKTK